MAAGPESSEAEEGDVDAVRAAGGRGRFYMESKPALGLLLLKGKKPHHRQEKEKERDFLGPKGGEDDGREGRKGERSQDVGTMIRTFHTHAATTLSS